MPYQASRWRVVFQAKVPTTSPSLRERVVVVGKNHIMRLGRGRRAGGSPPAACHETKQHQACRKVCDKLCEVCPSALMLYHSSADDVALASGAVPGGGRGEGGRLCLVAKLLLRAVQPHSLYSQVR